MKLRSLLICVLTLAGSVAVWSETVQKLSDIKSTKLYTFTCERGGIVMNAKGNTLIGTGRRTDYSEEESQFAILKISGAYYLYSPSARKFFVSSSFQPHYSELGKFHQSQASPITFDNTHTYGEYQWVLYAKDTEGNTQCFNYDGSSNIVINGWAVTEGEFDPGNRWRIEAVGTFDPTEALDAFEGEAQNSWTESETFYLYNTDAGQFLNGGNAWGTHAILSDTGLPIHLITNEVENLSKIYFLEGADDYDNQHLLFRDNDDMRIYIDYNGQQEAQYYWELTYDSSNRLLIRNEWKASHNQDEYFGNIPTRFDYDQENEVELETHIDVVAGAQETDNIHWQLIPEDQYQPLNTFTASVPCNGGTVQLIFNVINSDAKQVEVLASPQDLTGALTIPATVMNKGKKFSVTRIGDYAFKNRALTSVNLPNSLTSIGEAAFESSGLTNITIPNNITTIGRWAFQSCENLETIILPESVEYIGGAAFAYSPKLTTINLPSQLKELSDYLFTYCFALKSINIPENVTTIKNHCFFGSGLTSITIPKYVTTIGDYAFYGCNNLEIVNALPKNPPVLCDNSFSNYSLPLYVPKGCQAKYAAANYWKEFKQILEEGAIVTDLAQLNNRRQYLIHTLDGWRGTLGVADGGLATTFSDAVQHRCDEASPFAIIQYEGNYYLYSVKDKKFITNTGGETDLLGFGGTHALNLYKHGNYFIFDFKSTGNTLNVNSDPGIIINTYGTTLYQQTGDESYYDYGNQFTIEEVGVFDPTEALAMFNPDAEYLAALQSITPEGQYGIYTLKGATRYYLTNQGYLTSKPTEEDCYFTFHQTTGDELYRSPGWKLDACFSNPKLTNGETGDLRIQGHILTDIPHNRIDWEGQVWYLDDNGYYAVRATNAVSNEWGAGTYWTAFDSNNDGLPDADYSWTPAFIWRLEPDILVGIEEVSQSDGSTIAPSGNIYDLSGRIVNRQSVNRPMPKGLYIRGGRKVVVK